MESDKGEAELRTTEAGVITEFKFEIGDDAEVGDVMFVVDTSAEKPAGSTKKETPAPEAPAKVETPAPEAPKPAEPAKPAPAQPQQTQTTTTQAAGEETFVTPMFERVETREKMSRMRKTIAKRLKDSQNTYASISTFNEVMLEINQD